MLTEEDRNRALMMALARQGIRFPMPQPVQATPASPLPRAPIAAPVIAPQAEAAVAPQQDEFAAIRAAAARAAPQSVGIPALDKALAAQAAAKQAGSSSVLDVLSQAREDPEIAAIRQAKLERGQKELAGIEEEQKRAGWNALARAGFAMAQSNSPYFMQALASGMEAGLNGLEKAKVAAAEKRSRIQAEDEDARLAAITGRQAAQDRALAIYNAAISAGKSEAEARDAAMKSAVTAAQLPQTMEMGDLEVKGKRAQVAKDELELSRLRATPLGGFSRSGGGGGGGSRGVRGASPTAVLEEVGKFTRALPEARQAAADAYYKWQGEKDPAKKQRLQGDYEIKRNAYRQARDRLAVLEGRKPGSPYKATRPASSSVPAATMRYDPKTGKLVPM